MSIQTIECTAPTSHYYYPMGWRGLWRHLLDVLRKTEPARVRWLLTMWVKGGRLQESEVLVQGACLEPVKDLSAWKGPEPKLLDQEPKPSGGWLLVPREPTQKMLEHALTACRAANISVQGKLDDAEAMERVLLRAAFQAMLEAAPTAGAGS